jgi:cytochrome c
VKPGNPFFIFMHHQLTFFLQPFKKFGLACLVAGTASAFFYSCKTSPATSPAAATQVSPAPALPDPGPAPEENRFVKNVLSEDLNEPMELAVAPDGRVFFIERAGKFYVYEPGSRKTRLLHQFPIPAIALKISTDGLLGVTLDPDFQHNNFIYFFYTSQQGEAFRNNLSRFRVGPDNTLDLASEKVLLYTPIYMKGRSHGGGSMAWDKHKNLYISIGDDVLPTQSKGFAPIDERPGREHFDAQSTSANTNDLRGKILRIHPQADGSYTIPQGNLFAPGTPKTRPEIYVMGLRQPYRISVDTATSILYWGEVGPDAGTDGELGSRGYDEFNQAKKAGNFGWPYFIGDSQPYRDFDFATNTIGELFNAQAPVNNSVNNTGLTTLPPAQKAMIWYPYAESPVFPALGKGGRTAMGGPVYHYNPDLKSDQKLPRYYDKALFIYEWMRGWVFAVRLDAQQNYVGMERFMPQTGKFIRPMDMEIGPEGALYVLEYGSVYNADNDDARLVRVDFNAGNRAPVARISVPDSVGTAPLTLRFNSQKSYDFDAGDKLSYEWTFEGQQLGSREANPEYTFAKNGIYQVLLKVSDPAGTSGVDTVEIKVGNTRPQVAITSAANKSFFFPGQASFPYAVQVKDKEDTAIDAKRLKVQLSYVPQADAAQAQASHPDNPDIVPLGKTLMDDSDCKACHTLSKKAIGPPLLAVAKKYSGDKNAVARLANKVITGGGGVWGPDAMNAHPQLSREEATEIIKYVLSLATQQAQVSLPRTGAAPLRQHNPADGKGQYLLTAAYTDKGGAITPLTSRTLLRLRPAKQQAETAELTHHVSKKGDWMELSDKQSYFGLRQVDLTGLKQLIYRYAAKQDAALELRIGSPIGQVIGRLALPATGSTARFAELHVPLQNPGGRHDLYFVAANPESVPEPICRLDWVEFGR